MTITGESLTPVEFLTASPSSAPASFASLADNVLVPRLKEKEAAYILLRRHDAAPRLVAATYVPDAAPVRQKMLFASTRLALVRELGSEHFRETIFATTAEELSGRGFQRHDAHNALAAPLTEEERTLGDVKRAEQEAGHGTSSRDVHLSRGLKLTVAPEAVAALRSLNEGETLVSLVGLGWCFGGCILHLASFGMVLPLTKQKINPGTEVVELAAPVSPTPTTIEQLAQSISATEPRFTFFRFAHEHGGNHQGSPLLFFYTCPATAGSRAIKFRMMYPLMKRAVLDVAEGQAGLVLEKKFEVDEPGEITEAGVLAELHPQVEVRHGFSRPKRPGR